MNIALITDDYLPSTGGITNVVVNVSGGLKKNGHNVLLLNNSYDEPQTKHYKIIESESVLRDLKNQSRSFFIFQTVLLLRILFTFKNLGLSERLKLSYYYCFHPKNLVNRINSIKNSIDFLKDKKKEIIFCGKAGHSLIYGYVLSRWFNLPLVSIAHGDDFLIKYPLDINTIIFQKTDGIIITNRIMRALLKKIHHVNSDKLKIIHLGVNILNSKVKETKTELRKKYGINQEDFLILTVSRFYPRKGFDLVLKALKKIIEKNPDIRIQYNIIGSGEEEQNIRNLVQYLELDEYVSLLGFVSDEIKNEYYKVSDLFVLTPKIKKDSIEGFGIVYLEANFFNLPVIGSRSGGVQIAIQDGYNGVLIEPENIEELSEKILFLYENRQKAKQLGNQGHERVLKDFNWKINVKVYENYLKKIIQNYRKA